MNLLKKLFRREAKPDLTSAEALFDRATAYAANGNLEEAAAAFREAAEMDPDYKLVSPGGSGIYALADFNKRIEAEPNNALAWAARGEAYTSIDDYEHAIADFDEALRLDPNVAVIHFGRGAAHQRRGDPSQAVSDYNRSLELEPGNAETYYNRGVAYTSLTEYREAISDFDQSLRLKPDDYETHYARANARGMNGDYDLAISNFDRVIELNPEYAIAYAMRGDTYARKWDYSRAIADYETVAQIYPRANEITRFTERVVEATRAIEVDPSDAYAYHNRGGAYRVFRGQDGVPDLAIANYTRAIELNPNRSDTDREALSSSYQSRGKVFASLGRWDLSGADFDMANRLAGIAASPRGSGICEHGNDHAHCWDCERQIRYPNGPMTVMQIEDNRRRGRPCPHGISPFYHCNVCADNF